MPENKLKELAQPYFYSPEEEKNNKALVILVHGFGASATETRPLGEYLKERGFNVYGVLLAGHGNDSREMDKVKWTDWARDIQQAYEKYKNKFEKVFVGGVSMGGALSLYMATKLKFDAVFTINGLYKFSLLERIFMHLIGPLKYHKPRSPQRIKWYAENGLFAYSDDPIRAALEANKLLKRTRKEIEKINIPALIIQSKADKTVSPESGKWIFDDLKTKEKELLELETGDHILTVDPIREKAFKKIAEFLTKQLKKK